MDRRDFIKQVSMYSAGLAGAPVFIAGAETAKRPAPVVAAATGKNWGSLAGEAVAKLGGMKAFIKPGMKVVVKPNLSFDSKPEYAANTHPEVLTDVIKQILEAGADKVTVFDRVLRDERRCYQESGVEAAMSKIGDKRLSLVHPQEREFVPVKIERGIFFRTWQFYKPALEADAYVNVPVAKHHGSAKLSLGLKNMLGTIGGNRGKIHTSLDQGIADLNSVITPTLTVIDATRILLRNGPGGGKLEDVAIKDMVLASADTVAVDAYSAKTLFNLDPSALAYLLAAKELGLGENDLSKIKVL